MINYIRDGKPVVPTRLRKLPSRDCLTIAANADAWFSRPEFFEGIGPACDEALAFLKRNDTTYDEHGEAHDVPWVNTDIQFTEDEVRLDLRRSILRTKAFSEGVYYLLKCLDKRELLPIGAISHADSCRELAEFAIHEHLMAAQFAKEVSDNAPETLKRLSASNISLSDLRVWYLYSGQARLDLLRAIVARMTSNGLWKVTKARKEGLPWTIEAGPVGIYFHRHVFFPTLRHFHDAMQGKM